MAFNFSIFPDALKIAAVTPVYKSDDKSKVTNYGPISVLPCLSKILEKLIKVRLVSFFEKHFVLYRHQYNFRSNHSNNHALLDIATTLYDNLNNKILSCLVKIDLKKAFDTASHERLVKLECYGVRGVALHLLKTYLTERKQYVNTNESISRLKPISMGVSQGSILGPLFYIIFVNDLHYAVNCIPRLHADGTCLLVEGKTEGKLQNLLNTELYMFSKWMILNRLTINPKKFTILVIQLTLRGIPIGFQLNINEVCVKSSANVKYLCVILDQHLNYKSRFESIAKKLLDSGFQTFLCCGALQNF